MHYSINVGSFPDGYYLKKLLINLENATNLDDLKYVVFVIPPLVRQTKPSLVFCIIVPQNNEKKLQLPENYILS